MQRTPYQQQQAQANIRPGRAAVPTPDDGTMIADLYAYEQDFAALTAGSTQSATFQIQQNTNFRWTKGLFFADIAAAVQTLNTLVIPLVTVLIQDQGSGQNFQSAAVPLTSYFGTGMLPFILPVPRTFSGRSAVSVTVTNFSAATTYNLRLTFAGQRLYSYSAAQPGNPQG